MRNTHTDTPIRLVVIHDSRLCREGIRQLCAQAGDLHVVADAAESDARMAAVLALEPDVILIGASAHWLGALDLTLRIHAAYPKARILAITRSSTDPNALYLRRAGAIGHISKDADPATLIATIRAAARGEVLVSPMLDLGAVDNRHSEYQELTVGEAMVLGLVAHGADNRTIARRLNLSEQTVANRLRVVYEKLGVRNRTQAALFALRHGWVSLESA